MVLIQRNTDTDETMLQTVPSAGFTPPCDYSNFAENFDLSLLPGGDQPVSPSTLFYSETPKPNPKIFTTFYPDDQDKDLSLTPDFQKLLAPEEKKDSQVQSNIYLEVPSTNFPNSPRSGSLSPYSPQNPLLSPNDQFTNYRQGEVFYPSSPEHSLYTSSPASNYSRSPCEEYLQGNYLKKEEFQPQYYIKEENFLSPCSFSPTSPSSYSSISSPELNNPDVLELLDNSEIKQENKHTVDYNIIQNFQDADTLRQLLEESKPQTVPEKPKDHLLLREILKDTSFQKKYNIKPFEFDLTEGEVKMEESESALRSCDDESILPVFNLVIEQMRKDIESTCAVLNISPDPSKWSCGDVLSWLRFTSRQFKLPEPCPDRWELDGTVLVGLSEEDFARRVPQGSSTLHAQLEIWKAAFSKDDLGMQWLPDNTNSSNASSGDISDEDEEETSVTDPSKPTTSRTGSHIHLWQFLKELLASPQTHSSCIRWLDRSKGIFKIEDSVKVARLWGKRKNRPAMNYDKLSRSIRQYYKKGIMKKTERSQRLVYQFCHPYNL